MFSFDLHHYISINSISFNGFDLGHQKRIIKLLIILNKQIIEKEQEIMKFVYNFKRTNILTHIYFN